MDPGLRRDDGAWVVDDDWCSEAFHPSTGRAQTRLVHDPATIPSIIVGIDGAIERHPALGHHLPKRLQGWPHEADQAR